jgi:glycosyltransferase involved in cell wall biosynthesis
MLNGLSWPSNIDKILCLSKGTGAPAARNEGARRATGRYIVFMDDDDLFANDFVSSRMLGFQEDRDCDVCYGPYLVFQQRNKMLYAKAAAWRQRQGEISAWCQFLNGWDLLIQGCMFDREFLIQLGPWDEELSKAQDLDYKIRLLANSTKICVVSDGYVFYRRHQNSITGKISRHKLESVAKVIRLAIQIENQRSSYLDEIDEIVGFLSHWASFFFTNGARDLGQYFQSVGQEYSLKSKENVKQLRIRLDSKCWWAERTSCMRRIWAKRPFLGIGWLGPTSIKEDLEKLVEAKIAMTKQ